MLGFEKFSNKSLYAQYATLVCGATLLKRELMNFHAWTSLAHFKSLLILLGFYNLVITPKIDTSIINCGVIYALKSGTILLFQITRFWKMNALFEFKFFDDPAIF